MKRQWVVPLLGILIGTAAGVGWGYRQVHVFPADLAIGLWTMAHGRSLIDDRLTVARAAAMGPFGVDPAEVLYINAFRDSSGQQLQPTQHYQVCGRPLDARFWSITAYDAHLNLFSTSAQRFSVNYENIVLDEKGGFCIHVGPDPKPGNWLPTDPAANGLNITIRLYHPSPALRANLTPEVLPEIHTEEGGV